MKKLFYFSTFVLPNSRAHGVQIANMCSALSEFFDVTLFLRGVRGTSDDIFNRYNPGKKFVVKTATSSNSRAFLSIFRHALVFANIMKKHPDAVFYTRDHRIGFFLLCLGKRDFFYEMHSWPSAKTSFFVRLVCRNCLGVVSTNEAKKERMIKSWRLKSGHILVARNGVSVSKFLLPGISMEDARNRLGLPGGTLFGYIGRFEDRGIDKGVATIVRIVGDVIKDSGASLFLVGATKEEKEKYERMITAKNIFIQEAVPHTDVPMYLRAMDYVILLYNDDPHAWLYSSGIKTFEYMASGSVILASRSPSTEEVLTEGTSIFFDIRDASSIKRAFERALHKKKSLSGLGVRAQHEVMKYDWKNRAQKIASFVAYQCSSV